MSRHLANRQTTLGDVIELSGIGVHSGAPVFMSLLPAEADTGIVFTRTDAAADVQIGASYKSVSATELCTVLGNPAFAAVATVEHLMAALRGMGVDNAIVELDGPEVAIMDGSAAAYVDEIRRVGLRRLDEPRRYIKILKPVRVELGKGFGELLPQDDGFSLDVSISFDSALIGSQRLQLDLTPAAFAKQLSRARTFGFVSDLEYLLANGYALGASLDNTVGLDGERVLNPEGLRYKDEFVRHKALDAVGDLALAGAPLIGRYRSSRGGHKINFMVLKALFADASNWTYVTMGERRDAGHAELPAGLAAAAYSPNVS